MCCSSFKLKATKNIQAENLLELLNEALPTEGDMSEKALPNLGTEDPTSIIGGLSFRRHRQMHSRAR